MNEYKNFAYLYDELTFDVDYKQWADYIENLFAVHLKAKPSLIADLACGTGTMCNLLSDRGYDMIGIDLSYDMLNVAQEKSHGKNILYLNQDITEFELYGTVDAIICMLDGINHITDKKALESMFALVKNYLNPGGIFIFDINTQYKFENVLASNIYTYDNENIFYAWENDYDDKTKLCDFYLTFFVKDQEHYKRFDESYTERCYTDDEIREIVRKNHLCVEGCYQALTLDKPTKKSERIFYIISKN